MFDFDDEDVNRICDQVLTLANTLIQNNPGVEWSLTSSVGHRLVISLDGAPLGFLRSLLSETIPA